MRVTAKKLVTLGLTALMAVGTFTTAFAADSAVTFFGQKPVESERSTWEDGTVYRTDYIVIIPGAETLEASNITVADGWKASWSADSVLKLSNFAIGEGDWYSVYSNTDGDISQRYLIAYIPSDVSIESLGENAKYVIYANGSTQTSQPTQTTSSWASDSKGWWIQNSDGSYLTNAWYQSPTSGLWYYMGADGYMLTNTTTPDGHTVNTDGVWVQ